MARKKAEDASGRFVVEIPVGFTKSTERAVLSRLRAAQRLSNDILAIYLKRAAAYYRDPDYRRLKAESLTALAEGRIPLPASMSKDRRRRIALRKEKPVPEALVPRKFVFATAAERSRAWADLRERHGLYAATKVSSLSEAGAAWYEVDKVLKKSFTAEQRANNSDGLGSDVIHHVIADEPRLRVLKWIFAQAGHPRFASRRNPKTSFSGSSSARNGGSLRVDLAEQTVQWCGALGKYALVGHLEYDLAADPYLRKALKCPIRVVRLLHRQIRNRRCWYVQLVLEGSPPIKPAVLQAAQSGRDVVGIDLGAQHYAAVALRSGAVDAAWIDGLAPTAAAREAARDRDVREDENFRKRDRYVRRMQRLASQKVRRNPKNAHAIGTIAKTLKKTADGKAEGKIVQVPAGFRKGARLVRSRGVAALRNRMAEIKRADTAARDTDHGTAVNRAMSIGAVIARSSRTSLGRSRLADRSADTRRETSLRV